MTPPPIRMKRHEFVRRCFIVAAPTALKALSVLAALFLSASAFALQADIVFQDFDVADYGSWTAEGTAFGKGPSDGALPGQQRPPPVPGVARNINEVSFINGALDRLNAAWGTTFAEAQAIGFPDPEHHAEQRRRWVDFISWIEESQVRNMVSFLKVIRTYFPTTILDIPLGFGSDLPRDGCDRTAICRAAADFKPVTVRSTHASFNRNPPPLAYWFYKRMAPVCHRLGIGFGTEPPGGDLTYNELRRQYFEDASAGASYVFHYFQNYHQSPDVIGE